MASKRKRRKKRKPDPLPPPDVHNYILVRTKEGSHWRRKRGTVKEARLNSVLKTNARLAGITSPAAKKIKNKLLPFFHRLDTGRFIARISARFIKTYSKTGKPDLSVLDGYEFQPDYYLDDLLRVGYNVTVKKGEVVVTIDLDEDAVKQRNQLVTGYFFEAILLSGDPTKSNGLRVDSDTSALYDINQEKKTTCRLSLILPVKKTSWIAVLKLSCREGKEPGAHPGNYGMKVIKAGIG